MIKNFVIINYVFAGMLILFVLMILYAAVYMWKTKSKFLSVVFVLIAGVMGYIVYVVYGPLIVGLFK